MKLHFVLDENIVILAQKRQNDRAESDTTCLELIRAIVLNCHAIVLGKAFWGMYCAHMKMLISQRIELVPGVLPLVAGMLRDSQKDTKYVGDDELVEVPGLSELRGVDSGDALFVRAAASVTGSILVTTDGPLTRAIRDHGIAGHYGFLVRFPQEALELARQV